MLALVLCAWHILSHSIFTILHELGIHTPFHWENNSFTSGLWVPVLYQMFVYVRILSTGYFVGKKSKIPPTYRQTQLDCISSSWTTTASCAGCFLHDIFWSGVSRDVHSPRCMLWSSLFLLWGRGILLCYIPTILQSGLTSGLHFPDPWVRLPL